MIAEPLPSPSRQSIFITGASSGIGREFAYSMASPDATLFLAGRDVIELEVTRSEILKKFPRCLVECLPGDLTDESYREALIEGLLKKPLDVVVLNAGGGNFKPFLETNWLEEDQVITLNLRSVVHLSRALIPQLLKRERTSKRPKATLIFVSSHAAFLHTPRFSVYGSCKSFVNSFALTLVQELRHEPIDILLLNPGATGTRFSVRAGLPQKMLSEPMSPKAVVQRALKKVGRQNFSISSRFDQMLYFASRMLPTSLFDTAIVRLQSRLLRSARK